MNKKMYKKLLCFLSAMLVMFGLMLYRSENDNDKDFAKLKLEQGQTAHYVVDLGKEGSLKYLLEPNIYTVYFRLQPKDKPEKLSCTSEGLHMMLSQSSKKGVWVELKPQQNLRMDKGSLPLNVELYVPREDVKRYHVGEGKLKLYTGDKVYATLVLEVVNSRYQAL